MGIIAFLFFAVAALLGAVILLIILAVLLVPVDLALSGSFSDGQGSSCWRVSWGGIRLKSVPGDPESMDLFIYGQHIRRLRQGVAGIKDQPKPGESPGYSLSNILAVLPLVPEIIGMLRKRMSVYRCDCSLTFGLDGAAATGSLYGWLCAVRGALSCFPNTSFSLEPVFDREYLDIRITLTLRLHHPLLAAIDVHRILRKARGGKSQSKPLPHRGAVSP